MRFVSPVTDIISIKEGSWVSFNSGKHIVKALVQKVYIDNGMAELLRIDNNRVVLKKMHRITLLDDQNCELHITEKAKTKLYIITADAGRPSKIGISNDPVSRHLSMQSANWNLIYLHKVFAFERSMEGAAQKMEVRILTRLSNYIIRGEWLDMEASLLERIVREEIAITFDNKITITGNKVSM